jgi:hypothetical protein
MIALPKKSYKKNIAVGIAAALLLVVLALMTYVYGFNGSVLGWPQHHQASPINTSSTDPKAPTESQIKAGNNIKQNSVSNSPPSSNTKMGVSNDQPPSPTPNPGSKSTVSLAITSTNQNDVTMQIRSIIYSIQNTGTCTLTLTKLNNPTITMTAGVQALPSSSTCKGFDVPLSQLSKGQWTANLDFSNDTVTGSTVKIFNVN